MARGRTWTPDEDASLTTAWGAGISTELIGAALSRTPAAVRAQARRLGLELQTRETIDRSGWTKVLVELPDELLPAKGQRGVVIREALELRARLRAEGIEGTPAGIVAALLPAKGCAWCGAPRSKWADGKHSPCCGSACAGRVAR